MRHYLDCTGLSCPEPMMLLRAKLRQCSSGDTVELISEDPVSKRDIPIFCNYIGHTLEAAPDAEHPYRFIIRKK